jgi:hypothetical protein
MCGQHVPVEQHRVRSSSSEAITRARSHLTLVGPTHLLKAAVMRRVHRGSGIAAALHPHETPSMVEPP